MDVNSKFGINKLGLLIGLVCLFFGAAVGVWWLLQPSWQPIINSVDSPQSRLEIRNKLMEWGTPFKEDAATGNILVRDSDLLALRAKLGETGIPEERSPGLEIFSEAEYGMSEFTQRINYQRAIESEISNTIRSFADVNSARVHLTIPKQSIFRDEKAIPKASVTIKPRPGQQLTANQISGISQLVAASIDGLSAENVIVLNNKGEIISVNQDDSRQELKQSKFDLESYYALKARDLVLGIARTDDVKVSVNVIYNFDKVKAVREQILPKAPGEFGHLQKLKRHTVKSSDEDTPNAKTTNLTTEEEFLFSKERSEIEYSPGEIEKLSVGIVIMRELPQATVNNIVSVVTSGLGLDTTRGDNITVVAIPTDTSNTVAKNIDNDAVSQQEKSTNVANSQSTTRSFLPDIRNSFVILGLILIFLSLLYFAYVALLKHKAHQSHAVRLSPQEQEALLAELKIWLSKNSSGKSGDA